MFGDIQKITKRHFLKHNLLHYEKSTRHLLDTVMLFGGNFDLFSRIIFGAKSDQNRIDGLKLDNVFNELFAKSLYLLPQSK